MVWWVWLLIALGVVLLVGIIVFFVIQLTKPKPVPIPVPVEQKTVILKETGAPLSPSAQAATTARRAFYENFEGGRNGEQYRNVADLPPMTPAQQAAINAQYAAAVAEEAGYQNPLQGLGAYRTAQIQ